MLVALKAISAMQATPGIPPYADTLTHLQAFFPGDLPECHDPPYGFVAWYERILAHSPFIAEHRRIGVAYAAILDGRFDFFRP
jgi:hypothetical protein